MLQMVILAKVVEKHPDRNTGDDAVTDDTEDIGELAEKEEA